MEWTVFSRRTGFWQKQQNRKSNINFNLNQNAQNYQVALAGNIWPMFTHFSNCVFSQSMYNTLMHESKKKEQRKHLINLWNISYCFVLCFAQIWSRLRVPVCCWCGVSTLLSFHYVKFYCCWSFVPLFNCIRNCSNFCFSFMHFFLQLA